MSKFIIRLDDACPTMCKKKWKRIEKILLKYNIKPLVAVIPDNKDKELYFNKKDNEFWKKVNYWRKINWDIGIHGYSHINNTNSSGLLGVNNKSEFSNLSYNEQKRIILKSFNFFKKKKIDLNYWIAPFHSFDKTTIKALKELNPKIIISDGFSFRPFSYLGLRWIPQQLWKFYNIPFGVWTICLHPNYMKNEDFIKINNILKNNSKKFISVKKIDSKFPKKNIFDDAFEFLFRITLKLKKYVF